MPHSPEALIELNRTIWGTETLSEAAPFVETEAKIINWWQWEERERMSREDLLREELTGTSLAVQWLRLCLPGHRVWVQSLVRELRSHMPLGQKTETWKQKSYCNKFSEDFKHGPQKKSLQKYIYIYKRIDSIFFSNKHCPIIIYLIKNFSHKPGITRTLLLC